MMKNFKGMLFIAVAAMSLASCNKNDDSLPGMTAAVLKNGNAEYWKQVGTGIVNQSFSLGLGSFIGWTDADDDAKGQIENLDTLGKVKNMQPIGLIVAPVDRSVEEAAAAYAAQKNVSVVVLDTPIDLETSPLKSYYRCFVGTDNAAAGEEFASCVKEEVSKMVCFRIPSSQPAKLRFDAFVAKKGAVDDVCATLENINEKVDSVKAANTEATTYVFFNGSLCSAALEKLGAKDVYTFDVYKNLLKSLCDGGCVKGIMAQDTFTMGVWAVRAFFSSVSGNLYVDPVYFDSSSLGSSTLMKFVSFYGGL